MTDNKMVVAIKKDHHHGGGGGLQVNSRTCPALWRPRSCCCRPFSILVLIVLYILLPHVVECSSRALHFPPLQPPSSSMDAFRPLRKEEICPSMDIRNTARNLSELEGCRVVEGFLHIVLMEQPDSGAEFNNHSYPKLREITGYLLLYRVFGLRSIGQLFPNLAVIRGQQLLFDFSFVVYEMMQLQEIGLKSLTEVQRGSVLIEKNPNLCYAESIDWGRIGHAGWHNHFIQGNKKASECPKCPDRCPAGGDGRRLCWNNDECQKVCDHCGQGGSSACSAVQSQTGRPSEMRCCHPECAGGCSGNQSNQCDVCKHVIHDKECKAVCPPGFYLFMKRRCVKDTECIRMPVPRELSHEYPDVKWNWKVFESGEVAECILECPPGFQEQPVHHNSTLSYFTCVQCKGPCPKFCKGAFVNNIETAQKLRGCTTIMGNLDLQIKGGDNIIQELERSLGSIEEIRGFLKVVRSFPLLSLGFLKNLRNITGSQELRASSFEDDYALIVQDNQNLQQLWPKSQKLTIHKKMLFHFNPKLCYDMIEELYNSSRPAGEAPYAIIDTDISRWSNGDKATCDEQVLNVTVVFKSDKGMMLMWSNFKATLADKRQLLGYIISYIEAPHQNVTYYDGRDACGGDGWRVQNVAPMTDSSMNASAFETNILTNLKPYTQYAIYVQTYTVAPQTTGQRIGARSNIIYERTSPAAPDRPENLRANANSSSELVIEWNPPINQNGIVTHYIVIGSWRPDDQEYVDKHEACTEYTSPVVTPTISETKKIPEETSADNRTSIFGDPSRFSSSSSENSGGNQGNDGDGKCCSCSGSNDKLVLDKKEKEQQFKIEFENVLHNKIYVKNTAHSIRNKRQVDTTTEGNGENGAVDPHEFPEPNPNAEVPKAPNENHTNTLYRERLISFYQKVTGATSYTVVRVRHFAEYTIEVQACHDLDPLTNKTLCSMTAVTSARTKQSDFADEIEGGVILYESNSTTRSMRIGWNQPEDPNGLIVKYLIEYRRSDNVNAKPMKECVRRKDYIESNRTRLLTDLSPGNYCVQVRAFSLAGAGPPTKEVCFFIHEPINVLSNTFISLIFVATLIVVLAAIAAVACCLIRNKKNKDEHGIISINPDYHKYVPDDWEVARENVDIIRELGQGSFGMVYEGLLRDPSNPDQPEVKCAIKTVNEKATINERIQFLNEANVMKEFNAHHVLKLLGVVSKAQPTLVIMELMANGDLKSYLRSHRPDCEENISEGRQPPTLKCILKMAIEIADGMLYLSEKKYVHRDLAARNCMVAGDLTVKIGDFGLTRDVYEMDYYRKGSKGLLPVRWMAPESLRDGVYTSQCDVWSFGVVLWEMATLASQPYQGLSNEQVLKYVIDGGVMERPEGCPDRLYNLMESCWQHHARRRPTFVDIIENLLPDVPAHFTTVSFYSSDAGVRARSALRAHHEQETQILNDPSTPLREAGVDIDDCLLEEGNLPPRHRLLGNSSDQVQHIDDDEDDAGLRIDEGAEREDVDVGDEDHVPVLFPSERRAYILVRNPSGPAVAANGNGSKSDSSKGGGTTSMASEDSKGSYVSNGSTSNGYVMGILKQRRHNSEC